MLQPPKKQKHSDKALEIGGGVVAPATTQQPSQTLGSHYKGKGRDLIHHRQDTNTVEECRDKIISQIERYCSRYGKKDNTLQEVKKILDYATRLHNWEGSLVQSKTYRNIGGGD